MLLDQFIDTPVREMRKFLVMSSGLDKKKTVAFLDTSHEHWFHGTLTLPNNVFFCLHPYRPLKQKTIDTLDVSGNSFVTLMTAQCYV